MAGHRSFLADTDGATTDWIALSAGIILLGAVAIYEVFLGGTNELVSEMNRGLTGTANRDSVVTGAADNAPDLGEECDKLSENELAEDCDRRIAPDMLPQ